MVDSNLKHYTHQIKGMIREKEKEKEKEKKERETRGYVQVVYSKWGCGVMNVPRSNLFYSRQGEVA